MLNRAEKRKNIVPRLCIPLTAILAVGTYMVPLETAAASSHWANGPYYWTQSTSGILLNDVATHHCVLTKVQGKFAGGGEWVRVHAAGSSWWMEGGSKQEGLAAEAHCFPRSAFLANGSARWTSEQFQVSYSQGGCGSSSATTWWGDAATMLSGLSGKFEGGGEQVRVTQSTGAFTSSAVVAQSCQGWLEARAYSFFAGQPQSGQLPKFWGAEYTVGLAESDTSISRREVRMAPVGDAMCYLTKAQGDFGGGGERIRIFSKLYNGVPHWHLEVTAGKLSSAARRYMQGAARCYKRNQL